MLSDRRYPRFWNLDSNVPVDVVRVKSSVNSLFNPTCVPVRVSVNLVPKRMMPGLIGVFLCKQKLFVCRKRPVFKKQSSNIRTHYRN